MKKSILTLGILAAAAVGANAQVVVVDFGESNAYVTADATLQGGSPLGNNGFSASNISPASGYSGPTFWGGAISSYQATAASNWNITNDDTNAGGFDAIRVNRGSQAIGATNSMVFVFSASQNFSIDNNTSNSAFYLNARRQGGQMIASVTGLRWVLQDTSNNYYISALDTSTAAQYGSAYSGSTGVTQGALVGVSWFNYNPGTGIVSGIGSAIADEATFFSSTQFKSAGFWYTAGRDTTTGGIDMRFADFSLTAVPEPTTWALLAGSLTTLVIFRRRRRE